MAIARLILIKCRLVKSYFNGPLPTRTFVNINHLETIKIKFMKRCTFLSTLIILATSFTSKAQDKEDHGWSYEGKNRTHQVGFYLGGSIHFTEIDNKLAGSLGAKAGLVFNQRWALGLAGRAIWYDYRQNELVSNGTYHLEAAYSGLMLEYMLPLTKSIHLNFSLLTGAGLAQYKYDHDFREELLWYEEIIDRETFSVFEPGVEIATKLGNRSSVGLQITYRGTSPIKLVDTDEQLLSNATLGITYRYGMF